MFKFLQSSETELNGCSKLNTGVWGRGLAKSLVGALPETQSIPLVDENTPIVGESGLAHVDVEVAEHVRLNARSDNGFMELDVAVRPIAETTPDDGGITFGDLGKH